MNLARCRRLFVKLAENKILSAVTVDSSDIFYFTGMQSAGCLLLFHKNRAVLFVNSLYPRRAKWIQPYSELKKQPLRKVAFEPGKIPYEAVVKLRKDLKILLQPVENLFSRVRAVKEKPEIEKIARAQALAKRMVSRIQLESGMTEKDVFTRISRTAFGLACGPAYPPVVAFGKNTFFPHHTAGKKKYRCGETVLIDAGVKLSGYCSDLTRMRGLFTIKNRLKKAYRAVEKAREVALGQIAPGVRIGSIDESVRDFLAKEGFEKNILHSTGHGIGIDVHEWPPISKGVKEKFEKGMVFTLEPGLYFEGYGGVRLEDVYVLEKKARLL
ncbi:MAG: Xaa-Pro peptidase family protein [bacterium]